MTDQPDTETRAAVDALAYRLRNRGDADPERFAAEFIAALRAHGWRHGEADGDQDPQQALYKWAVIHTAGREDWDPVTLLGVIQSCKIAGVPYEDVAPVLWRLARTEDDHQDYAELRNLARNAHRHSQPGNAPDPGAVAALDALRRGDFETARAVLGTESVTARFTGPQPVLAENEPPDAA